jgi:hypothetical protein
LPGDPDAQLPQILYGVALTAVREAVLTVAVLGWQAVLHLIHAPGLFTDLPCRPFPVSWPDTGSGGTTSALTALAEQGARTAPG